MYLESEFNGKNASVGMNMPCSEKSNPMYVCGPDGRYYLESRKSKHIDDPNGDWSSNSS